MQAEVDINKQTAAQTPMFFAVPKTKSNGSKSKNKGNDPTTGDAIEFIDSDMSENNGFEATTLVEESRASNGSSKENARKSKLKKVKSSRSKKKIDLNGSQKNNDLNGSYSSFGFGDFDKLLNEDGSERTPPDATLDDDSFANLHDSFSSPTKDDSFSGANLQDSFSSPITKNDSFSGLGMQSQKVRKKKDVLNGGSRRKRDKSSDRKGEKSPRSPSKAATDSPSRRMMSMQPSLKMVKQKSLKSTKKPNAPSPNSSATAPTPSNNDGFQDSGDLNWFFPDAATTTARPTTDSSPGSPQDGADATSDNLFPESPIPSSPKKLAVSTPTTMPSPSPETPGSTASPSPGGKLKKSRHKSHRRSSMVGRVEGSNDTSAAELAKAAKEGSKKTRRRSYAGDKKTKGGKRRGSGAGKTHADKHNASISNLSPDSPTKQRKPPRELFAILDVEPWSSDNTTYSDEELMDAIEADPESVKKKYRFEFFGVVIYPFSMMCAIGSSLEAIKLCHKVFPEALNEKDPWVGSPLHYACGYEGSVDLVDWLLETGPDTVASINRLKRSPFHIACQFNPRIKILNSLLRAAPTGLEVKDKYGCTPMHLACENNAPPEVLEMMIDTYAAGCLVSSQAGATPLHMALENRVGLPKIKLLVKAQDSALEIRDVEGRCPLHTAVENECDIKIIKYLVKTNPNTLNIKTEWLCESPLEMAKRLEANSEVIVVLGSG